MAMQMLSCINHVRPPKSLQLVPISCRSRLGAIPYPHGGSAFSTHRDHADHIWNTAVDTLPVDLLSNAYIAAIGLDTTFHPDFGSGDWPPGSGNLIGIPYTVVGAGQPTVPIVYTAYGSERNGT